MQKETVKNYWHKQFNFSYIRTRLVMEEKTDLYARRKVRRKLFQDDDDTNETRENSDNRFSEDMRIESEKVRNKRFFLNESNSRTVNIISRHDCVIIFW